MKFSSRLPDYRSIFTAELAAIYKAAYICNEINMYIHMYIHIRYVRENEHPLNIKIFSFAMLNKSQR